VEQTWDKLSANIVSLPITVIIGIQGGALLMDTENPHTNQ